jgi:hypothetical protein
MLSLADTIRKKKLDLYGSTLPVDDSTVKALEAALKGSNERDAYHALELLNAVPDKNWDSLVSRLLHSNSIGLRKGAIEHLGRKNNTEYAEEIFTFINDPDPEVRAAAFDAYCRIQEERAMMDIYPFMKDADPLVKSTVVACTIYQIGVSQVNELSGHLRQVIAEEDDSLLLETAQLALKSFAEPETS